jgi:3-oxoadipate enol-lactonase
MARMERPGWSTPFEVPAGIHVELPGRGITFVRDVGPRDAPVLVLLHGLGATGALNWASSFSLLADQFRVLAVDHRGHGRGLRAPDRFRLADCADDVAALADELGIDRFIACGYSMGGPIAQLTAHRHPDRVEGLVLCATARDFRGRALDRLRFGAAGILASALGAMPLPSRRPRPATAGEHGVETVTPGSEMRRHDMRKIVEAVAALGRFSSRDWVHTLTAPTSVVVTTQDRVVPVRRQKKLSDAIAGSVCHIVDGDHLACASDPGDFVEVLAVACELVAARAGHQVTWLSA